jgi:SOS response regulatory protein OraA/RecX
MKIESLASKPDRAGRYLIRFDNGATMRLYRQTVEDHGLFPGKELDEEQLQTLRNDAGQMSAKMRAVRIVSASSVSKDDLRQRLIRKGETPRQAQEAVDWMSDLNLVDDRQTAEQIVSRCIARGYGLARAKQMLYEKKIPQSYWQEALEDYPDQEDKILEFLRARLSPDSDEREKKRVVDALLRRGHRYSLISKALRQLDFDEFPED